MRIVIWHHDRFPTAPGVYLGVFPRLGHEVTWVVSTEGEAHRVHERMENGVRMIEIERPRDTMLGRPFGVLVNRWHKLVRFFAKADTMRRLAGERPDVIQVRDQLAEAALGLLFARKQGIPFAYQWDFPHFESALHEMERRGRWNPWRAATLRGAIAIRERILCGADLVLPISEGQGRVARDRYGVAAERLVPFGVGVASDAAERARQGTPHPKALALAGQPVFCYMGNLEAARRPELLFDIVSAVLEKAPESRFLLVGGTTPFVDRLLASLPAERVVCTGRLPHRDVAATIAQARVGIFPLPLDDRFDVYRTSSPLKVVEYLACGLPVVASRVEETENMLAASGGGACVDNDPETFANAIVSYLRDPERAAKDGERGRAWVLAHRIFEVMGAELDQAYRRLLATGVPAAPDSPLLSGLGHHAAMPLAARRHMPASPR